MPEILKCVLPKLDLSTEPILRSDGLMIHDNEIQSDRKNSGSMTTMIYLRPCEDGACRLDIAVRRQWVSSVVPFDEVGAEQLYQMVRAKGLSRLAKILRAKNATALRISQLGPLGTPDLV